ncbi:MAG: ferrochelatase [Actinomycetota bacterium]
MKVLSPSYGERDTTPHDYDAILYLSFGGPEGPDDVMPYLANVTRGRGVPAERLEEVAQHYLSFGGVSPINEQNRAVIAALRELLADEGPDLPIYFGNRNWAPYVEDAVADMTRDGVRRAVAFVTSGFSSYSACRQYREDIERARDAVGDGAPTIDKIRLFYNHPGFIDAGVDRVAEALERLPESQRDGAHFVFTAHSVPMRMAETSSYVPQLREAARLVSERTGDHAWELAWQSRSGPPSVPWLEPDVSDHIETLAAGGIRSIVVVPIGFVSDHLEVLFDLDIEARETADRVGIEMVRAHAAGTHPAYVRMIRDLIVERIEAPAERPALGPLGPSHDRCGKGCCPAPKRPGGS